MLDRTKRLGTTAAAAVTLGALALAAPADAREGAAGAAAQQPPAQCIDFEPKGWTQSKQYDSCQACLAGRIDQQGLETLYRIAGGANVSVCREHGGGVHEYYVWANPYSPPTPQPTPPSPAGFVMTAPGSERSVEAVTSSGQRYSVGIGQHHVGDPGDPIVGFALPGEVFATPGEVSIGAQYIDGATDTEIDVHGLELTAPTDQVFAVNPDHEVIVSVNAPEPPAPVEPDPDDRPIPSLIRSMPFVDWLGLITGGADPG